MPLVLEPPSQQKLDEDNTAFWFWLHKLWRRTTGNGEVNAEQLYFDATQRVAGRNSAGAGAGEEVTATQVLDWIVATNDRILYRTGGAWGSAANFTFNGTTFTTPGQVAFPASQSSSADANTLDDYEEGTWTPTLTFDTPGDLNVAYTGQTGFYTKIGRLVCATFRIITSTFTHTTASGNCLITGMPFTNANLTDNYNVGALIWGGITKANYTNIVTQLNPNTAQLSLNAAGSGQGAANVAVGDMPTGGTVVLVGGITYFAAS